MADDFDPYQKWLNIPPQEQPPSFYRLLALKPLESDLELIDSTAAKLTAYLQARSKGKNAAHALRLLEEVTSARACLLNPERKAAYDAKLKRPADSVPAKPVADMSFLDDLGCSSPGSIATRTPAAKSNEVAARKQLKTWQPQFWQIGAAAGGVLLVIVVVFVIAGQSKPPGETPRRTTLPDESRFGSQTVDMVRLQAEQEAKRRIPRNLPNFAVPIRREGDFFLTAVTINGQPAGSFLLDTGAEATAISPSLAERLKLPEGDKPTRIRAIGGGQTASFRKAQTLLIGEVRFDNLQLVVIDLNPWEAATGAKFDGVIGCDVWGELMFCIDPQLEKLTFYDRDRLPRGDASGEFLTEIEHRPFVTMRLDGGEAVQYMAATGCGHELMLRAVGEPPETAGQGGASAATDGPSQRIAKLTLFGETFENLSQATARWDDVYILKADPRQAGVVGGHVLANFKLIMDIQRHKVFAQRIPSGKGNK